MTAAEVAALSSADRHRLMLGTLRVSGAERDWRRLYGTHLTTDERYAATMRWAQQRQFEALRESLRRSHSAIAQRNHETLKSVAQLTRLPVPRDLATITPAIRPFADFDRLTGVGRLFDMRKALGINAVTEIGRAVSATSALRFDAGAAILPGSLASAQFGFGSSHLRVRDRLVSGGSVANFLRSGSAANLAVLGDIKALDPTATVRSGLLQVPGTLSKLDAGFAGTHLGLNSGDLAFRDRLAGAGLTGLFRSASATNIAAFTGIKAFDPRGVAGLALPDIYSPLSGIGAGLSGQLRSSTIDGLIVSNTGASGPQTRCGS